MAVVGEAHIIVRAITTGVERDIRRSLRTLGGETSSARRSGESLGQAFARGFNTNANSNIFNRIVEGLDSMAPAAEGARRRFQSLVRTGYTLGAALGAVIGGISSVAAGLVSLVGAAGAASVSVLGLVGAFVSLQIGALGARLALGGIGAAVGRATQAQTGLGNSLQRVNEQFRQLKRDAESAAMSEKRAALELEKARNNLNRMLDLPPNNMARREAELALEEAELNYRQAKERSKDLNTELAKGKKGLMDQAGIDPYAGLTKSQREFAERLVELKPKLDELKEAVAKGFLPLLGDQLERLANGRFFDVIKRGLEGVGDSLGISAENFTNFLDNTGNLDKIDAIFNQSKPTIEAFGTILGKALDGFLSVLVKADPLVKQFVAFLDRNLGKFADFMNAPENQAEIEAFFATVGQLAKDFAEIFGNIFGGFGNIIKANIGPGSGGQILIDYLKEITGSFKNLQEIDGKPLREFFAGAAENAKSVLGSVGALLKEIFALADNPAIGETFDILKQGAAPLGDILEKYIEAGPSFANLVVTLTEISNKLTDTGAMQVFFDTLNNIATVVNNVLGSETAQNILTVTGRIFAFISAIGLAFGAAKFLGLVIVGAFKAAIVPIGIFMTAVGKARQAMAFLTYSNSLFVRSIGNIGFTLLKTPILIALAAIVGMFIYLYETSDEFRKFIDTTFKSVLDSLSESFGKIMEAIQPLIDLITGQLLPILADALQPIFEILAVFIGSFAVAIGKLLVSAFEVVIPFIVTLAQQLLPIIDIIGQLITLVGEFFKALISGDWTKFGGVLKSVFNNIIAAITKLFEGGINMIIDGVNSLLHGFFNGIGGGVADVVNAITGGRINLKKPNLIPKVRIKPFQLAEGGVVMPRRGGTLATVAEAGRPERVEPLDPQGLSRRDRAIIKQLAGTNGMTVNVYPSAGMDEKELAELVSRRIAFEIRKGIY